MTTGTKTINNAVVTPSASGNGLVGLKETRTWNGTDYPAVKPTYSTYSVPVSRRVFVVRAGKKSFEYVQAFKLRRLRNKPPKRARIEEHPYTMSYSKINYQIWDQRNNPYQSFTPNRYGWDQYMISPLNSWNSNDDIKLLGKLREKVAGSSFNAGVALGESREALHMITNAAVRIYWSYRAAKHGDFRSARRYLIDGTDRSRKTFLGNREASNNWLELQYGWLPLLNDAKEGAEFLAHQHMYPLQQVIRTSYRKQLTVQMLNKGTAPLASEGYTQKSIKAILKEKDVISLSGLTDPLSVAWELMPYSFVIDWFIPIGNYLAARGLSNSLTGTFVTSTKTVLHVKGLVGGQPSAYGPSTANSPCEKVEEKTVTFSRVVSTSLSVPKPEVKPLGEVLSWKRAANAVALLVTSRKLYGESSQ